MLYDSVATFGQINPKKEKFGDLTVRKSVEIANIGQIWSNFGVTKSFPVRNTRLESDTLR